MQLTQAEVVILIDIHIFIGNNPEKKYSVAYLVANFQIHEDKLRQGYKFIFKEDLKRYQLKLAMNNALQDLQNGGLLKQIAAKYGYKNQASFSRTFKKIHTFLPKQRKSTE